MLWDVDHTLIDNGGMSKATYAKAFTELCGHAPEHPAETDGRTDPMIMANMLERNGVSPTPEMISEIPAALEAALKANFSELQKRGHALPGAHDVLNLADKVDGLAQSALTGNIIANAKLKLDAFDLSEKIDWEIGGFGSDSDVRSDLVDVAIGRANRKFGVDLPKSAVVLVGDTLRDVEAGVTSGVRVIGVATGKFSTDQLVDAGADVAYESMSDAHRVLETVKQFTGLG